VDKEKRREYLKKNRDRINAQKRKYYQKNIDNIRAIQRAYRQTEEQQKYMKEYREKNKERLSEQGKKYNKVYYKRPEIIQKVKTYKQTPAVKARKRIFDKRYYKANKPKISTHQKLYNESHKEELQEWHKKYQKEHHEELAKRSKEYRDKNMREFISTYKMGKCCEICGYKEYPEILQFHHKNKSKKSFTISTSRFMKPELLRTEIEKCVLICPNCHMWLHYSSHNNKENVDRKPK